jgi:outer membrane protein
MNLKSKLIFSIFTLSVQIVNAQAPQVHKLSVTEAVNLAFQNLPSLKNLELDVKIQQQVNKQIEATAYPQLTGKADMQKFLQLPQFLFPDGTATAIYSILKQEGVRDGSGNPINKDIPVALRQVSFQQPWNASAGVTLSQLLFQPDVFVGLQARQATLDLGKHNIEIEKEKIREQAYKQYYGVLIAQKQLVFVKEGIARLEKLKSDVEQLYKQGFREKLDIDKVQVPLNNLKTSQNLLENGIDLNFASLKFSIGLSQKDSIVLTDKIDEDILKNILVDDVSFNYNDRKEIQLLGTARTLQTLDIKRQKLSNLPTVAAFLNYQTQGQGQKFITDNSTLWIKTSVVGLQLNVPIFSGFTRKYKINEATLKLQKVDNSLNQLKQVIDLEQSINKRVITNAILNLDIQKRNMELAKNVYNTSKKKYEQGLASSFELLTDQNAITDAESKYFEALYQAQIAKISYLKALGKLN